MEIFFNKPLASTFGMAGLLCQLLWPVFRARKTIMTLQFGIGADYGMQYALLGAWSGAGVAALGALQSATAYFAGHSPWFRKSALLFLPVVMAVCLLTWNGLASFFALIAVSLTMIGRMQTDTLRLRILLLAAAPFGMGYDVTVGALPALMGGVLSASISAFMLMRELRLRRIPQHHSVAR